MTEQVIRYWSREFDSYQDKVCGYLHIPQGFSKLVTLACDWPTPLGVHMTELECWAGNFLCWPILGKGSAMLEGLRLPTTVPVQFDRDGVEMEPMQLLFVLVVDRIDIDPNVLLDSNRRIQLAFTFEKWK